MIAVLPFEGPTRNALAPAIARVRAYVQAAKAVSTRRAYAADWRDFSSWCARRQLPALPATPETIALYLSESADTLKVATLGRRLAAIAKAHQAGGYESPCAMRHAIVSETWKGIRRAHGVAQNAKAPVLVRDLRAMLDELPGGLIGLRDRALLLVGFAGAFRRSELVCLDVEDLAFTSDGLVVTMRRSKTDQEGAGRKVGVPYGSRPDTCPVRALRAWLEASGIAAGPVFRSVNRHGRLQPGRLSSKAVALVVKRYAGAAEMDASQYAGHSLRAGLATSAAIAGASERAIMTQTGHRSAAMVRRYIRDGSLFRENAAAVVGL